MEHDPSRVYNTYTALKSAGRFNYSELFGLFSMGRKKYTWNDSVLLQTVVHNISIGRPTAPSLVDAIIAERRSESLKTLYQYAIDEHDVVNPNCRRFTILLLPHQSAVAFGKFDAVMHTPGGEDTRGWYVDHIELNSLDVISIAEPYWTSGERSNERWSSYTIFDNLIESVTLHDRGTLYLQCLEEQVEQFAGKDMGDLFHKFRTYADTMLEMHRDCRLDVSYQPVEEEQVRLQASVYKVEENSTYRTRLVQFDEVLKKVR
jgi:hypothetical protein